jgi:hypothetical protein
VHLSNRESLIIFFPIKIIVASNAVGEDLVGSRPKRAELTSFPGFTFGGLSHAD